MSEGEQQTWIISLEFFLAATSWATRVRVSCKHALAEDWKPEGVPDDTANRESNKPSASVDCLPWLPSPGQPIVKPPATHALAQNWESEHVPDIPARQ